MAAIDLQRSLEHGGGHPRATDTFDSEMQEWEDQLHDMQRKIEELYNEVQARRGGSDVADDNGPKNGVGAEFGPGGRSSGGDAFFGGDRRGGGGGQGGGPGAVTVPNHHNSNGCNRALSQQNGYGRCHDNEVSQIGDLLQDYLGQGKGMDRKNNSRTRRVHFDQTVRVSQDLPAYQDVTNGGPEIERMSQEHFPGGCEDAENRKNRAAHAKSHPGKESSPNKENTGANKPPLRQRDASAAPPPRAQLPNGPSSDSPALDRKSFAPGALVDRKCGSPSVLRKFGAMLQENEGKTLTDTGVVTQQPQPQQQQQAPQAPEPRGSTPGCQRRGLGPAAPAGRAPARVPTQKCQADSDALTAAMEPGQEWGLLIDSGRLAHMEQRPKGPHPLQSQRRAQVAGSPKLRPRANSGADRDTGLSQAERARRSAAAEPRADYRNLSASYGCGGAQRMIQKASGTPAAGQSGPPSCGRGRDDGLIELLDMLDIQHEYGSSSGPRGGHTSHRQDAQQGSPGESSPTADRKCFSRPARPANQRPPSRWAGGRTPATAPSGPMYRPPSPLARPPSPMTRSPSPARKQQQQQPPISYCLHTETVIM